MKSYKELVGLEISDARKKLGYWWRCCHCDVNIHLGHYNFERSPCARIELKTKKNVVVSEFHNGYAEFLLKNKPI